MSAPLLALSIAPVAFATNFDREALTGGAEDQHSLIGFTGADYLHFENLNRSQWVVRKQGGKQLISAFRLPTLESTFQNPADTYNGVSVNNNNRCIRFTPKNGQSGNLFGFDAGHIVADQKLRQFSLLIDRDYGGPDTLKFRLSDASVSEQAITVPSSGTYVVSCAFTAAGPGASLAMDFIRSAGQGEGNFRLLFAWLDVPVPPKRPRAFKF